MKIHCVHCDQRIAIPEEYFGTIVTCPACQGGLKLPPLPDSGKDERPLVKLDPRLERFRTRFQTNGFRIDDASNSENFPFLFNASKVRFEVMDAPNFLEEFFIFKEFPILDLQSVESFATECWEWATSHENRLPHPSELSNRAIQFAASKEGRSGPLVAEELDRFSARDTDCLIYIYAIAVTAMAETDALEWIHHKESAIDRKFGTHDTFVIPVAYDIALGEFHHLQGIPTLGNVFYSEARRVIELQLKPGDN